MNLTEKVSYIKGLMDGSNFDTSTPEGKIMFAMYDAINDLAESVTDLEAAQDELAELVDIIDQDLGDVEEDLYQDDDFNEDEIYEVTCPSCGEIVNIDDEILDCGEINCPSCGQNLEFDFEDECDCDQCEDDCCSFKED